MGLSFGVLGIKPGVFVDASQISITGQYAIARVFAFIFVYYSYYFVFFFLLAVFELIL